MSKLTCRQISIVRVLLDLVEKGSVDLGEYIDRPPTPEELEKLAYIFRSRQRKTRLKPSRYRDGRVFQEIAGTLKPTKTIE